MSPSFAWNNLSTLAALTLTMFTTLTSAAESSPTNAESRARAFIADHEARVVPLEIAASLAWWNANTSGKDEDFALKEEAQNKLDKALSDPKEFAELKAIRDGELSDPLTKRQIAVLYLMYLEKQVPPELLQQITAKSNTIEKVFNNYRAKVGDRELTDSQVRKVLSDSKDSAERKAVWEANKAVGPMVAADLKAVALLRNEAAKKLGFKNYHVLQLYVNEQDQAEILKLFDELDELTRGPFEATKAEIDKKLAADYKIPIDELRPWHYHDPFFQEPPAVFGTNLDTVFAKYEKEDISRLCQQFYDGIRLPIDDVLKRSDLYEKPGKSPHAFCTDINREGDVRVLANVVPNEKWMSTMLHELGHSVYSSKNIPASLPFELRCDSHILCTEGVAMMFERFAKSGDWLVAMGVEVPDVKAYNEAGARMRRDQLLIFSRWCQVMFRFEKALYEDPDQDLSELWWGFVEKYQGLKRPEGRNEPDYATKVHIVVSPAYYHNYLMGQLFACQVHRAIAREVLKADNWPSAFYTNNPGVGRFMRERVFAPGRSLSWNDLTKHATGEPLSPQAFAEEFRDAASAK